MAKQLVVVIFCLLTYFQLEVRADEVEKVFKDNEVVPDVIPKAPKEFLKVNKLYKTNT